MNFWRPEHRSRHETFFKGLDERLRAAREGRWGDLRGLLEEAPLRFSADAPPTERPLPASAEKVAPAKEKPVAEVPVAAPEPEVPPNVAEIEEKTAPDDASGATESPAIIEASRPPAADGAAAAHEEAEPAQKQQDGELDEKATQAERGSEADDDPFEKPIPFAPPVAETAETAETPLSAPKPPTPSAPAPASFAPASVAPEITNGQWLHQPTSLALAALPWSASADWPPERTPSAQQAKPAVPPSAPATARRERSAPPPESVTTAFFAALPWADGMGGAVLSDDSEEDEIASFHFSTETRDDARDWREAQGHIENPLLIGLADAARTAAQLSPSLALEEATASADQPSHARSFLSQLPWK